MRAPRLKTSFLLSAASGVMMITFSLAAAALPGQVRAGAGGGFGGVGLSQTAEVNGAELKVERSEGPLVFSFFVETVYAHDWTVGLEHARGLSMAPMTSGAHLTGVYGKWFFLGPATVTSAPSADSTILVMRRLTPFAGFSIGMLAAAIRRDKDLAAYADGSSLFLGVRLGADYPMDAGWGLRYQLSASSSVVTDSAKNTQLSEFGLTAGIFYLF